MKKNKIKVGLVLAGGGAKGAYHAGALKALQELDIPIDMIAGASIGALNGSIIASAKNVSQGIDNVQAFWDTLPQTDPLKLDIVAKPRFPLFLRNKEISQQKLKRIIAIQMVMAFGLKVNLMIAMLGTLFNLTAIEIENLFSDEPLVNMMENFVDIDQLQSSLPLYISIFEQKRSKSATGDMMMALFDGLRTSILGIENDPSVFRHVQSLDKEQQKEFILASASVPLLLRAYKDEDNRRYTDGGQGGLIQSQGNIPITPLVEAGCSHIIVIHFEEQTLWQQEDFVNSHVIEIHPSVAVNGMTSVFDFSQEKVQQLKEVGYYDAKTILTTTHKECIDEIKQQF